MEQQADVVAERDGRVTSVSVEIGDHVRRGQVLALLDDRALQAARAEKAARIDSLPGPGTDLGGGAKEQ